MAVQMISSEVAVRYCPCIQVILGNLGLNLRYFHFLFPKINFYLKLVIKIIPSFARLCTMRGKH